MENSASKVRRDFLKTMACGAGALVILGGGQSGVADDKAKKPNLVKESDPLPKGLGYVHDATKAQRTDKAGTKAAEQLCSNCQFYMKNGELDKEEVGKCQIIPNGVVKAKGWCKSWIKKPG